MVSWCHQMLSRHMVLTAPPRYLHLLTISQRHLLLEQRHYFSQVNDVVNPTPTGANSRSAIAFLKVYRSRVLAANNRSSKRKRQLDVSNEDNEEEPQSTGRKPVDNMSSILGGVPLPDPSGQQQSASPPHSVFIKSFRSWVQVFQMTWTSYKLTWEGFLSNQSALTLSQTATQGDVQNQPLQEQMQNAAEQMQLNLNTNLQTLQKSSQDFVQYAKDSTNIHNKTDLKKWVMIQLQLATDMVREFMDGYRQARQEEMERTITQYFKDLDENPSQLDKKHDPKIKDDETKSDDDTNPSLTRNRTRKTVRRLYQWVDKKRENKYIPGT